MFNKIIQILSFAFFLLAIWLIGREIRTVGLHKLWEMILQTPWWVLGFVLIATCLDFIVLCGYDILGLKYIRQKVALPKILEASTIGFAVSNTVGHAYVSGGAIRYLFYGSVGLSRPDILKLITFETLTIFMGIGIAFIISVAIAPFEGILKTGHYLNTLDLASIFIIITFIIYDIFIVRHKKGIRLGKMILEPPNQKMTAAQLLIGLLDNFCVFLAFYSIFRYHLDVPLFETFSIFIIAQTIGLLTQVPGGLGVFESSFLYLYPHIGDEKSLLLTSLIIFRVMYYFLPFILASLYLILRYVLKFKSHH